jgi:diguanylate cyclase (GGDEF)-like protein
VRGAPASAPSQAERSLDRQVFYLNAIAQIGRTLATVGKLDQLLVEIADYFTEVAAVRWTCVYLRDPGTDRYRLHQSKFVVTEAWVPPETVPEASVAGLWKGPEPPREVEGEAFGQTGGKSFFLPLFTEGAPTGFLLFGEKLPGGEILADEREFLNTLATQAALAIRHASLLDETARRVEELTVLNEISRLFTRGNEPFAEALQAMWERLHRFLGLEEGLVVPLRQGAEEIALGGRWVSESERKRVQRWCELLLEETDRGSQLRRGEVVILDGSQVEGSFPAEFRPPEVAGRTFCLLPVFYDQGLDSLLLIQAVGPRGLFLNHRRMLQNLSPTLSSALQKTRDHVKLERLATTDGLTGLYNHRYFHDRLQQEYLRAYRLKDRVGLLLLDVDHFKSVNDAFGHVYGDQVLLRLAEVLKAGVREIDIAARYGGEEFAVILPQASCAEAATVGERVRYAVEQTLPLRLERKIQRLTVSVGAAAYPETASTKEKLVEAADGALYLAKHGGRNQVVVAEPFEPVSRRQ